MVSPKASRPGKADNRDNIYLDASREFLYVTGAFERNERYWRVAAFTGAAIALLAVIGCLYIGAQSKFVPYIVEVNKLGDAVAVRQASVASPVDNRIVAATIARWVTDSRSVYIDAGALRRNIDELYAMLEKGSPAEANLNQMFQARSPFDRAKDELVDVQVEEPLAVTPNTWRVEWQETVRPRGGQDPKTTTWTANITFDIAPQSSEAGIVANPGGIFVRDFSWAQRF